MKGQVVKTIAYVNFKHKIRLVNELQKKGYKVQDLNGILMATKDVKMVDGFGESQF